jgi:hypothetical protein
VAAIDCLILHELNLARKMVLEFSPPGNATDPCSGVDAYSLARPKPSEMLVNANIFFLAVTVVLVPLTAIWTWLWRKKPRFRKVRPFSLGLSCLIGLLLYHIACFLPTIAPTPCALVVTFYIISVSLFASMVSIRGVVITVETQYSKAVKEEANIFTSDENNSTTNASTTQSRTELTASSFFTNLLFLCNVSFGLAKITAMNMSDLVNTKRSYSVLFAIYSVPGIVCCVLVIALVPQYQTCYNCDVFLELPIAVAATLAFYVPISGRAVIVAFFTAGWDDKGVIMELLLIPFVVGAFAGLKWILMIVDPGGYNQSQIFNWSLISAFGGLSYWIISFGYQGYRCYKDERSTQVSNNYEHMEVIWEKNPDIKKDFFEYGIKQYVSESLQFLEDVQSFKRFYHEKGQKWRLSKFKLLVQRYIISGSSFEINISYAMKMRILQVYESSSETTECFDTFDDAYRDILLMIEGGAWRTFIRERSIDVGKSEIAVVPIT